MDAVIYIHGKGGNAAEAEHYNLLFPSCDVIGLEYKSFTPWEAGMEIHAAVAELNAGYDRIILIANSLGVYLSMNADIERYVTHAFFISPIVDMEKLISDMMGLAGITGSDLQKKGTIHTDFGEDLSWEYLSYVREHPVDWNVPTDILYGSADNLTSADTITVFAQAHHREVENLVRESFWNVYRPGCSEHYVIHVLRDDPAFIKELDFVMERDGRLIGQNMFMKTIIEAGNGRVIRVLTMGPIGITPELKRKGYGKALLDYSLEKAAGLGYGAVLFEGNIGFYGKCGFTYAREFGVRYHDLPEGADDSFFLCKELIHGYLDGVTGVYQTPQGYYVEDSDVEKFDKGFPPKQKLKLPGQIF